MKLYSNSKFVILAAGLAVLMGLSGLAFADPAQSARCPVVAGHQHMGHSSAGAVREISGRFAEAQCSSCHGLKGVSISATVPNLAGQEAFYLCGWLAGCRQQGDKCEGHEDIAAKLSDQDIVDLAEFYAQLPAEKW